MPTGSKFLNNGFLWHTIDIWCWTTHTATHNYLKHDLPISNHIITSLRLFSIVFHVRPAVYPPEYH